MVRWVYASVMGFLILGCSPPYPKTSAGIPYDIRDQAGDPVTVSAWIDLRLEEWTQHKADWGCGAYSDDELLRAACLEPVKIYPGYFLPARPDVMGWNVYDGKRPHIDITIDFPASQFVCPYDPEYARESDPFRMSYGLQHLPHEWTHTVRGAWHP